MKTLVKHYTASLRTALRDSGASAFYMLAMCRSHSFEGGDISGVPMPFTERTSPTRKALPASLRQRDSGRVF